MNQVSMRNAEFERFVDIVGGAAAAAEKLGCAEITVYKLKTRELPIQHKVARIIMVGYPGINLHKLMFPDLHDQD